MFVSTRLINNFGVDKKQIKKYKSFWYQVARKYKEIHNVQTIPVKRNGKRKVYAYPIHEYEEWIDDMIKKFIRDKNL